MLRDEISNAMKGAMKARDEKKVSTLRMVNAAIKNADIEARGQGKDPLDDGAVLGLLQKMIKQRQESVELYDKGGRPDLASAERAEIEIITGYLPKQMSDAEMTAAIEAAIKETGAASMKDMGKVVGVLRGKFKIQIKGLIVRPLHHEESCSINPNSVDQLLHGNDVAATLGHLALFAPVQQAHHLHDDHFRSEERRVGKECRSRWSPYH